MAASPATPAPAERHSPAPLPANRTEGTTVSHAVSIHGDIRGSEPIFVDGEFDGTILLEGADLTIGPNGRVRANVDARHVIIEGRMEGKLRAREKILVRRSGSFSGEVLAKRVAIEEGAVFNGKVEMGQSAESVAAARAAAAAVADAYNVAPRGDSKPIN
ncbi:MAG TPA: polymer-forming cytoskeletal protein [Candidatus Nitrosotenuis sp.]|nr:polymer-forming cytoskeletal protein [Candidatus Nitrosotenuis sp.]